MREEKQGEQGSGEWDSLFDVSTGSVTDYGHEEKQGEPGSREFNPSYDVGSEEYYEPEQYAQNQDYSFPTSLTQPDGFNDFGVANSSSETQVVVAGERSDTPALFTQSYNDLRSRPVLNLFSETRAGEYLESKGSHSISVSNTADQTIDFPHALEHLQTGANVDIGMSLGSQVSTETFSSSQETVGDATNNRKRSRDEESQEDQHVAESRERVNTLSAFSSAQESNQQEGDTSDSEKSFDLLEYLGDHESSYKKRRTDQGR